MTTQQQAGHYGTCDDCGEPFEPTDTVEITEDQRIICPLCTAENESDNSKRWGDNG